MGILMGQGRKKKYDRLSFGLITGILVPLVIFFMIYFFRYSNLDIEVYLQQIWKLNLTFKILSLCGFTNLLIFFYFYRSKMDKAARGIILATFIYAFLFLVFEVL
jgi:hypothetical protein